MFSVPDTQHLCALMTTRLYAKPGTLLHLLMSELQPVSSDEEVAVAPSEATFSSTFAGPPHPAMENSKMVRQREYNDLFVMTIWIP
jgi:hypothetical protein